MHPTSRAALLAGLIALPPLHWQSAGQPADTFRISKAVVADASQDTLQAVNPATNQTTEVFPGTYQSPLGAAVMTRVEALSGRMDEADRHALIKSRAAAGFDRSITSWRAHPSGRTVAMAVRYYRAVLSQLELEVTDDYGRADPVDPTRYEFFAIAVCTRGADAWTCREEQLAEAAGRYNMPLPQNQAERIAAAAKLVELVLGKQ
jgi:hypothetical protein